MVLPFHVNLSLNTTSKTINQFETGAKFPKLDMTLSEKKL